MASANGKQAGDPIRIDIVSDVVCPWCIIGYKQLERAQAETGVPAVLHWHPFELNPAMPEEGQNLVEHITAKYGTKPDDSEKARSRMTALGASLGFAFNYRDDMRIVNTFRAHQLLHWAGSVGRQHHLKMALFSAFFTDRKDVNDPETLVDVAAGIGLDRQETLDVLADGRFAEDVRVHEAFWTSRGVEGVPTILFEGRHAAIGAKGVEAYAEILRHLTA